MKKPLEIEIIETEESVLHRNLDLTDERTIHLHNIVDEIMRDTEVKTKIELLHHISKCCDTINELCYISFHIGTLFPNMRALNPVQSIIQMMEAAITGKPTPDCQCPKCKAERGEL